MKAVLGILMVGGGAFILVALFNGTLHFPLGDVNLMGNNTDILGPTPPQTSNPSSPGYVPPQNTRCKPGTVFNTKTGQCIPRNVS